MVIEPQTSSTLLPSQQQLLLRIQHLATLESSLVLVAGREGAGKYTIASALLEQYGSEFSLAWLTCHPKSTTDSLRQQLLSQLLPQGEQEASLSLHQHLSRHSPNGSLRWLIVVNQAELLGNPLLVELWGLVEHCRQHPELSQHISIVLFAEPDWSRQVAQEMRSITGSELPMMQVPALTLAERKQLFVHLQSRLDGELLDVELSERLLNDQDGLPGEVVAMFESTPARQQKHEEPEEQKEPLTLSLAVPKKVWLFALAFLPALAILWWAYQGDEPIEPVRHPAPAPTLAKPAPAMLKPKVQEQVQEAISEPQPEEEVLPGEVTQVTLTADSEDESHKQRVDLDEQTLKAIEQHVANQPSSKLAEVPVVNSEPKTSPKVVEQPEVIESLPEKPVTDVAQPAPIPPWWQQINAKHFVLQLVLMSSEQGIDKFAQQHGLTEDPKFRRYPAQRNGKRVYIGVYGDFASKEEARSQAQQLKAKHTQLSPWPKSAAAVKQEAVLLD